MYENELYGTRRFLGLTGRQLGLLGGMVALLCLAGCILFYIVSGPLMDAINGNSETSVPATDTPSADTATPTRMMTATITKTPIGGWREYSGQGVALMLPNTYIGGDPAAEETRLRSELTGIGLDASRLDPLFSHQPPYRFLACHGSNASGAYAFVLIATDPGGSGTLLDNYINQVMQQNVDAFFFMDRASVWLDNYSAVRYTVESKTDRTIREYQYFIQDQQNAFWVIVYSAPINSFAYRIADFELSAMTFRSLPNLPLPS